MKNYNTPEQTASEFAEKIAWKNSISLPKFACLAFLGGVFIALGGLLTVVVVGGSPVLLSENPGIAKLLAGALFPIGLILVSVAGGDLFTSDCAGVVLAKRQKRISGSSAVKILVLSYVFNFVGAQFVAYFMSVKTGLIANGQQEYLNYYALGKIHQDFWTVFMKGIGANWLVCLGSWMGYMAKDVLGKCVGIWVPVMLFVTLGYEHSIANMFFIPAAIYAGADISWGAFIFHNLIPATLGNLVGGCFFVGALYGFVFLSKENKSQ